MSVTDEQKSLKKPLEAATTAGSSRDQEADFILSLVADDGYHAFSLVAQQINVSHGHATSILQLVAIVSAISGALLPQLSSKPIDVRIITMLGLCFILGSGIASVIGVLRPTWVTEIKPKSQKDFPREMVQNAIKIRSTKSKFVMLSAGCLIIGLLLYGLSAYYVLFFYPGGQ